MLEEVNEILKKMDSFNETNQLTELDIKEMKLMKEKLSMAKEELVKTISNGVFYEEE